MTRIHCKTDKIKITVGEPIALSCSGNEAGVVTEKLQFKLAENQKYILKVLNVKKSSDEELSLDFTIYAPGDYKISEMVLSDGVNELTLNGASVKVESVIKPSSDGKPQEPYGPIFPIGIDVPMFYYLGVILVLLLFVAYGAYQVKRKIFYKTLKDKLNKYSSPIAPDIQFYRAIRKAEKAGYPLQDVEEAFRLYNLRAYHLPMFDLNNPRISNYFKRNYPQFKSARLSLIKTLGEFEELQKRPELSVSEKSEFIKKLHRYVSTYKGLES